MLVVTEKKNRVLPPVGDYLKANRDQCKVCLGSKIQWVVISGGLLEPGPCPFCLGKGER